MRRGLMAWDANELPLEALQARLVRTQASLAEAKIDALLLYTNFVRSGAVCWLTGFSPYWADGLLMVPAVGEPVFATTLSNRVATWVQSVKPVGALVHSPRPAAALGESLARSGAKTVAVLELDDLPAGLYDELVGAAPDLSVVDGTALFARVRTLADDVEAALLGRAEAIAEEALARGAGAANVGAIVGAVEESARLAGAEEAYVAIAPDLAEDWRLRRLSGDRPVERRYAVRASVAYKGVWTRRTRTFALERAQAGGDAEIEAWFARTAGALDPNANLCRQVEALAASFPGARLEFWIAESTLGSRPLEPIAPKGHAKDCEAAASWAVLTLRLSVGGAPWLGARLIGAAATGAGA